MAPRGLPEMPPWRENSNFNRKCTENGRFGETFGAAWLEFGASCGVVCLGGTLCKFPQRYIDHKLQVSLFHTSLKAPFNSNPPPRTRKTQSPNGSRISKLITAVYMVNRQDKTRQGPLPNPRVPCLEIFRGPFPLALLARTRPT